MLTFGDSELLLHIAELSVAFAGFAGLASVFREHADRSDIKVDAGRLISMLTTSLLTAIMSLVPLTIDAFRVSSEAAWRISGLIALLTWIAFVPGGIMRTQRMARYEGFSNLMRVINFSLVGLAAVAFIACAFGLPNVNPGASYLSGLLALLIVSSTLFFRVIVSLLQPHAPE